MKGNTKGDEICVGWIKKRLYYWSIVALRFLWSIVASSLSWLGVSLSEARVLDLFKGTDCWLLGYRWCLSPSGDEGRSSAAWWKLSYLYIEGLLNIVYKSKFQRVDVCHRRGLRKVKQIDNERLYCNRVVIKNINKFCILRDFWPLWWTLIAAVENIAKR